MSADLGTSPAAVLTFPPRGVHWGAVPGEPPARICTGLVTFDNLLGGGLPRGVITHLVGRASSGRTALAYALVAAATGSGESAAWIDFPDALDPEYATNAGVELSRLLWVRPPRFETALRTAEIILQAGGFAVTLVDLTSRWAPERPVPPAGWIRLARAATRARCAVVSIGVPPGLMATLCLETQRHRSRFVGNRGPLPLFEGIQGTVGITKSKMGPPGRTAHFFAACAR